MWLISIASSYKGPSKLSSLVLGVPRISVVQNTSQSHSPLQEMPRLCACLCVKLWGPNLICAWRRQDQQFLSLTGEVISIGGEVQSFNILILQREMCPPPKSTAVSRRGEWGHYFLLEELSHQSGCRSSVTHRQASWRCTNQRKSRKVPASGWEKQNSMLYLKKMNRII